MPQDSSSKRTRVDLKNLSLNHGLQEQISSYHSSDQDEIKKINIIYKEVLVNLFNMNLNDLQKIILKAATNERLSKALSL